VGPQSAGADPGPVCYGRGGTAPTVTDANLVLGRLNPDYFLGGEIALDVAAAGRAIQARCAGPLGMDGVAAAYGIVEIANAAMVNALRLVSIQRGYDPREFALVAFGGAGPAHANRLAAEMEVPTVVIPMSPGTTSALGLLVTDLKHDYSTTLIQPADRADLAVLGAAYRKMEAEGRETLAREGVRPEDTDFLRQVDARYKGQSYELTIPLPGEGPGEADIARVLNRFHAEHDRAYGYSAPVEPVEFVTLRLTATGRIARPRLRELGNRGGDATKARKAVRSVYFAERGGYVDCPIYDRYRLGAGGVIEGPGIVEELDSTTVIHPGYRAEVDRYGNLILRVCTKG
jgi:N-methylhydantoinase A